MPPVNATVIGGLGFAGKHLTKFLASKGYSPSVVANTAEDPPSVLTVRADITNQQEVSRALHELAPSHLYHLAAVSSPSGASEQQRVAFDTNVWGTRNVCNASLHLQPRPRILNVSTSQVYMAQASAPLDENAPTQPSNVYAATKLMAELWCEHYSSEIHIVTARSFNHTGPGQSDYFVVPYLARCVAEVEAGIVPPVIRVGDLKVERDFTDVRDVVRAYHLLMLHGMRGNIYNVCSGRCHRLSDLLDILLQLAGVKLRIEVDPARIPARQPTRLWGDHAKLTGHTGWKPEIPIEQTLHDTLAYWRATIAERAP